MKLIVGLGNPGEKYKNNRHNVGYLVLDELARKVQSSKFKVQNYNLNFQTNKKLENKVIKADNLLLVKPQTYMNESGRAVKKLVTQYKLEMPNVWVIHDDLDIALGSYKIQKGKGPRLHKGVLSIEEELREDGFWRVRVGVENRGQRPEVRGQRIPGDEYVLQDFEDDELDTINKVIDKIIKSLISSLTN